MFGVLWPSLPSSVAVRQWGGNQTSSLGRAPTLAGGLMPPLGLNPYSHLSQMHGVDLSEVC